MTAIPLPLACPLCQATMRRAAAGSWSCPSCGTDFWARADGTIVPALPPSVTVPWWRGAGRVLAYLLALAAFSSFGLLLIIWGFGRFQHWVK